jgi:hypothetical protein
VFRSTRESRRHNRFSKDSLELQPFPLFHRTRRRLCTLKPASAAYGAKLLLRKVPQYMGHGAICQVNNRPLLDNKSALNPPIDRISFRKSLTRDEEIKCYSIGSVSGPRHSRPITRRSLAPQCIYGVWRQAARPALANALDWAKIAARQFLNGAIRHEITNTGILFLSSGQNLPRD